MCVCAYVFSVSNNFTLRALKEQNGEQRELQKLLVIPIIVFPVDAIYCDNRVSDTYDNAGISVSPLIRGTLTMVLLSLQ